MNTIKAWHFATSNKKLCYGDSRPVRRNVRYFARPKNKELELCHHGMHGSLNILDALKYAPGNVITWCEFGGQIIYGKDKLVADWRKPLWVYNATLILQEFSRWCALQVAHLWKCPDVVKQYLETGDEALREKYRKAAAIDYSVNAASTADAARSSAYSAVANYSNIDAMARAANYSRIDSDYADSRANNRGIMNERQEQRLIEMLTNVGWENS